MKLPSYPRLMAVTGTVAVISALVPGCASKSPSSGSDAPASEAAKSSKSNVPPLPAGVTLHKDKDIQGVWLASGFNFKGYEALSIEPTSFKAIERPNEVKERTAAIAAVQADLVEYIADTKLFTTVSTNALTPGVRGLRMMNTVIEYEKGGGAGRYFAGIYGAGQPVIKVRGEVYDGDTLMCVYEVKRSGESGSARMFGGFMGDTGIQANDIRDLAVDLADFLKRTAAK